jgi:AcrR family transcriptional regulator
VAEDVRERILGATIVCLGRFGIAKTTVDDAARTAGVARATVYRHFPDGRDQLIAESITWAVGQFFHDLFLAVADDTDIAVLLEHALTEAHRAVGEHAVLQKVLETEPERLMPQLSQSAPVVQKVVRSFLAERLAGERLRPGVDVEEAADWLSRIGLSFIIAEGSWDLSEPDAVRRLVRDELLVAIIDR